MSEPVIECEHVASGYNGVPLMADINLTINKGEIVFILGGSGCGKSTLLKHMIGQVPPVRGTIRILGKDIHDATGAERANILRSFGMMYQSGALFGNLTVLENVLLPLEEFTDYPEEMRLEIARTKLAQVKLLDRADAMPAELSGGQKKRAAIARAMALDPPILFLDEPSAGLDPITSADLDATIKTLAKELGMTIVIISHELASIEEIADRAFFLGKLEGVLPKGGVLDSGPVNYLKHETRIDIIRDFFNRKPTPSSAQ